MTRYQRQIILEQLIIVSVLVAAITIVLIALMGRSAHGGELTDCAAKPGSGRWVYRVIDERRCWFPAGSYRRGQEKPAEELRWPALGPVPEPVSAVPSIEPDVIVTPQAPMSEFERRWRGAVEGWDHKE